MPPSEYPHAYILCKSIEYSLDNVSIIADIKLTSLCEVGILCNHDVEGVVPGSAPLISKAPCG